MQVVYACISEIVHGLVRMFRVWATSPHKIETWATHVEA